MHACSTRLSVDTDRVKKWMQSALRAQSIEITDIMWRESSAIVFADVMGTPGESYPVVCRVVTDADWLQWDGQVVEREYRICNYLRRQDRAIPDPLGIDARGELAGAPAVVMSRIPGAGLRAPYVQQAVSASAQALARLHSCEIPASHLPWLGRYRQHEILAAKPRPRWFRSTETWNAAVRLFGSKQCPSGVILHRDFRMENLLFSTGSRLSGIVDWTDSAIGCPMLDVSHFQVNLILDRQAEHSEVFRQAYIKARPLRGQCAERCLMRGHIYATLGMLTKVAKVSDEIGSELEILIQSAVRFLSAEGERG